MQQSPLFWIGFHCLIFIFVLIDMGIYKKDRQSIFKKPFIISLSWIVVALLFNAFVYFNLGYESALQFFTGYLVEKSLSVDNLFLFLLTFTHFHISEQDQRKILNFGIIGALVFRLLLILSGLALIQKFHWMFYVFGSFLLFTSIKFMLPEKKTDLSDRWLFKIISNLLPIAKGESQGKFFVRHQGKWKVTVLFLALIMIELTDVIFALDSIPAIYAITTDSFIVYTSNIFAILGLRALYFDIASLLKKLRYFKYGLAAILGFVSFKMLTMDWISIPVSISLAVIILILATTTLASFKKKSPI